MRQKKMKISGIYKVANTITGDFYIGSSKNIQLRWANHKSPSTWTLYPRVKLYQAFIKYGLNNFTFDIIEETADLHTREQYYIEQLKPSYNDKRAKGWNTERYKESHKQVSKAWYKAHRDEELARNKAYYETHRDERLAKWKAYREANRDELLAKNKAYYSRLCLYEGETLTLRALTSRFYNQGVTNPTIEAKKYLIEGEN